MDFDLDEYSDIFLGDGFSLSLEFTAEELAKRAEGCATQQLIMWCKFSESIKEVVKPIIWGRGFAELPTEVTILLAEHLPRPDLLKFARSSKKIHQACLRAIYGVVDLSIHNRGRVVHDPVGNTERIWHYSRSWWCRDVPVNALTRQEQFIQQLILHPEYAVYTKSLTWTLLLLQQPNWSAEHEYPLLGTDADGKIVDRPIWHIWEVFSAMTNVKILDLAYLSKDQGHPLASRFPNALFPKATSIRLSGAMQYALAASILAPNPGKLEHLIWDNLQQPEHWRFLSEQVIAMDRPLYQTQIWAPWNTLHDYWWAPRDYFAETGPMHNLLGSLAGRCTNLTSLTIRKTAEVGRKFQTDLGSEFDHFYSSKDKDMYAEWAVFLEAQKNTIQKLELEQGPMDFRFPDRSGYGPQGRALVRVMDSRFQKHIWPVIMFEEGDWPCLTHLSIKGVKNWFLNEGMEETIKDMLRTKFGDRLSVVIEPESDVMDHIGMDIMP